MAARKAATKALSDKTCKEITDLIVGYVLNELSPTVRRHFRQHLRICPDCASFLNTYKKTVASTRSLRAQDLPAKVRKNILDFLRARMGKSELDS
jgi:anti-sigma factor RsiW